jgi:putative membrane protein
MDRSVTVVQGVAVHTFLTTLTTEHDHWAGPGPWWPVFPILWFLLVLAAIATFGFLGRRRWGRGGPYAAHRAGEARLAERYAAGEIDEQEYAARLATLRRLGGS